LKPLVLQEVPVPEPGRGEILVRIEATGHARTSPRAYSGLNYNASKERAMNWQSRIFTATLALISFIGDINNTSPAAAASHYPLWVCGGRYGGWGWSRPAGPFTGLTPEALFRTPAAEYWYPAYTYAYTYTYPYPYVIYVHECRYWWVPG
jgi:hypothetical protein